MEPGNFWSSGMWIFPIVMMIIMLFFMSRMFGRGGGFKPPWLQDSGGDRQDSVGTDSGGAESPVDILNTRYAKGEISKEEYDQMKSDLI